MKHFLPLALVLLLLPISAAADDACRSDRIETQHFNNRVVTGNRSVLPMLQIGPERPGEHQTFVLKGTFCDSSYQALVDRRFELVRYERRSGKGALKIDDLTNGAVEILETFEVRSLRDGKFVATGLLPGDYAIRTDWNELPETRLLVFDLRIVPGPSRERAVVQSGLLQPH